MLGAAPLDEIGGERPGGAAEAEDGHAAVELAAYQAHGVEDVAQGLVDIGLAQAGDILAGAHRVREGGAVPLHELQLGAHRLQRQQDVGEEDGGVDAQDVDRLDGHLGGELGGLAEGEEVHLLADGAVFGEIAAGLAHQPDGAPLGRLPAAGSEK